MATLLKIDIKDGNLLARYDDDQLDVTVIADLAGANATNYSTWLGMANGLDPTYKFISININEPVTRLVFIKEDGTFTEFLFSDLSAGNQTIFNDFDTMVDAL